MLGNLVTSALKRGRRIASRALRGSPRMDSVPLDGRPASGQATEEDIYYCYRLILGRNPDPVGWRVYQDVRDGYTLQQLTSFFFTSPEFKNSKSFRSIAGKSDGELPVLVDLQNRKQYVSPEDYQIGRAIADHKLYEPHLTAAIERVLKPGMTFVDVGANIGYFTLLAAARVGPEGRVIAFEPSAENANLLFLSARANGFANIELLPFAVAEREMTLIYDRQGGSNGIVSDVSSAPEDDLRDLFNRTLVRSVVLDKQLRDLSRLDVIKIDIEGAEYRALAGATELIERFHPIIFSEFGPLGLQSVSGVSGEAYLRLLTGYGYHLAFIAPNGAAVACGQDIERIMTQFETEQLDHIDIAAFLPGQLPEQSFQ